MNEVVPNWQRNPDGTFTCLVGFNYDEPYGENVRTVNVSGPITFQGVQYRGCTRTWEQALELESHRPS